MKKLIYLSFLLLSCFTVQSQTVGLAVDAGYKGLKIFRIEVDKDSKTFKAVDRNDFNIKLGSDLDAVNQSFEIMRDALASTPGVGNNFYVTYSSAVAASQSGKAFKARAKQEGWIVEEMTVDQEGIFAAKASIQPNDRLNYVSIDWGSGNQKIAYAYESFGYTRWKAFDIPYGTASITEAIDNGENLTSIVLEFKKALIRYNRENILSDRKLSMQGGLIWAIATAAHPARGDHAFVDLTYEDIVRVENMWKHHWDDWNSDVYAPANNVFNNPDELTNAIYVLRKVIFWNPATRKLDMSRTISFSRYGNHAVGYAAALMLK